MAGGWAAVGLLDGVTLAVLGHSAGLAPADGGMGGAVTVDGTGTGCVVGAIDAAAGDWGVGDWGVG
ncbi:hypothetical protein C3Y87_15400, partial [Carbonactinospora thermoautotrophica]|nr:hypothetical protein [Carbonactinospora thermoautotrophica]